MERHELTPPRLVASYRHHKGRGASFRNSLKEGMSSFSSLTLQTHTSTTDGSSNSTGNSSQPSHPGSPGPLRDSQVLDPKEVQEAVESLPDENSFTRDGSQSPKEKSVSSRERSKSSRSHRVSMHSSQAFANDVRIKDHEMTLPGRRPSIDKVSSDMEGIEYRLEEELTVEENENVEINTLRGVPSTEFETREFVEEGYEATNFGDDNSITKIETLSNKNSSHHGASVANSSFAASYGSLSLGGDASLSSADSFNNSASNLAVNYGSSHSKPVSQPDLSAAPDKAILKPNPNPNPKKVRQEKYYSSDEESNADKNSISPYSSQHLEESSNSSWEESLQPSPIGQTKPRGSVTGSQSDISIKTYSDTEEDHELQNSMPANSATSSPKRKEKTQTKPKSNPNGSSISINSSFINESWNNGKPFSALTMEEEEDVGPNRAIKDKKKERSYSSWSSGSEDGPTSERNRNRWASEEPNEMEWSSGDESSVSEEIAFTRPLHEEKTKKAKPRSAYDKNAPWYCGEEDDDFGAADVSINSDTSSVLSNLQKKKSPAKAKAQVSTFNASDGSISFSNLLGGNDAPVDQASAEASMSFGDLEGGPSKKKASAEASMSLGDLAEKPASKAPSTEASMSLGDLGVQSPKKATTAEASMSLGDLEAQVSKTVSDGSDKLQESIEVTSSLHESISSEEDSESSDVDKKMEDMPVAEGSMEEKKFDPVVLMKSAWFRWTLYIGLALFFALDIVLIIVLLIRK